MLIYCILGNCTTRMYMCMRVFRLSRYMNTNKYHIVGLAHVACRSPCSSARCLILLVQSCSYASCGWCHHFGNDVCPCCRKGKGNFLPSFLLLQTTINQWCMPGWHGQQEGRKVALSDRKALMGSNDCPLRNACMEIYI